VRLLMRKVFFAMIVTITTVFFLQACHFDAEKLVIPEAIEEKAAADSDDEEKKDEKDNQEDESPVRKLTLLVYMAADNDLESYAIQNLKAMEHADFSDINVLVLMDRAEGYDETNGNWTDTRLFKVNHDDTTGNFIVSSRLACPILGLSDKAETELDMGNYYVLKGFIDFAKAEYPAEKYALIIWGHGTGWRFSDIRRDKARAVAIDDKTDSYMGVFDMGRALKDKDIAVIGFDTCFGGVLENLYEIRNSVNYSVASAGVTPSGGWDYKQLLEEISSGDGSAEEIALSMKGSSSVQTSLINNRKLSEVMNYFELLSKELSESITNSDSRNEVFNNLTAIKSYCYSQYPCDMYLDLFSMAEFYSSSRNHNIKDKAEKLLTALKNASICQGNEKPALGIHFIPKTSANTYASTHSYDYLKNENAQGQCAFIKDSRWWVPSGISNSDRLLDKLFYKNY